MKRFIACYPSPQFRASNCKRGIAVSRRKSILTHIPRDIDLTEHR